MFYAQLNEDNICIGISQLSGKVDDKNMIGLVSYDTGILRKKYVDGKWEEVEPDTVSKPEPSETEIIQAEILVNQSEIIAKQKEQDEVLAELLLGQQEVAANV